MPKRLGVVVSCQLVFVAVETLDELLPTLVNAPLKFAPLPHSLEGLGGKSNTVVTVVVARLGCCRGGKRGTMGWGVPLLCALF